MLRRYDADRCGVARVNVNDYFDETGFWRNFA